jgi:hypothetical protein
MSKTSFTMPFISEGDLLRKKSREKSKDSTESSAKPFVMEKKLTSNTPHSPVNKTDRIVSSGSLTEINKDVGSVGSMEKGENEVV